MTKFRYFSVLLIAAFGAYILAAAGPILGTCGMNDGGGF
jgi:hypothetical protein